LSAPEEESQFPGLAVSALVLFGIFGSVLTRKLRVGLAVGVVVCALLSLGVRDVDGWNRYLTPYRFLFDFAPGWDGVRTPGRINTLTSLGLALLAGAGLCVVVRALRRRSPAAAAAARGAGWGWASFSSGGSAHSRPRRSPSHHPPSASRRVLSYPSRRRTRSTCT